MNAFSRILIACALCVFTHAAAAGPTEPTVSDRNLLNVLIAARAVAYDTDRLKPGDVPAAQRAYTALEGVIARFGAVTAAPNDEVLAVAQYLTALRDQIVASGNGSAQAQPNATSPAEPQPPAAAPRNQAQTATPFGMSEADALAFISAMTEKYTGNGAFVLPDPTNLLRDGALSLQEADDLISQVAAFQSEAAKDLPRLAALAPHFRSAQQLYAKVNGGALSDFQAAFQNFSLVLDSMLPSGINDAMRRAALDATRDAERIRGSAAQAGDRDRGTISTLEAAAMLEPAFGLPPTYTERLAAMRENVARYEALLARVGSEPEPTLPADIGDPALTQIAGGVLSEPRYGTGPILRLVVNTQTQPRRRIDTRVFDNMF